MNVIDIENPRFLKKMKKKELQVLASDIREFLIDNISKTGGHLSSNLGVVELTIAIHKVFNSPKDKIIFDVGHQSYTHKILTGRAKDFDTLRKYNGLSGFQKMNESIYDSYEAGHSSTSLSSALGFAIARDLDKKDYNIISVIGDGSIGNGLAYEALNHIGSLDTPLIVILNDNEMSISKNVGAVSNLLDRIRSRQGYTKTKIKTKGVLYKIPFLGEKLANGISLIKKSFKKLYIKDGFLFEELGFNYYGPINGHDFNELIRYLEIAKKQTRPVLLHVITEKGKGYPYAEEDLEGVWHGVTPFEISTGEIIKKHDDKISWSEVISNDLIKLAKVNEDLVVITPAMASGAKLNGFRDKYPDRFIDVGIAEEHSIVLANALAIANKRPFVSIYSTFLQRAYDEIQQDVARMNSPVVIGIDRAGIVGEDGETHQGIYDVSYLSHIPNMIITCPKDAKEAFDLLYTGFSSDSPYAIRYSRKRIEYKETIPSLLEIGSWEEVKKGLDGVIITYGDLVDKAIEISKELYKHKISIGVINARFIKPFDEKMFRSILDKNKKVFVYEEVAKIGSLGERLCMYALDNGYKPDITCFSIKDEFIPQGHYDTILKVLELDVESIYSKIREKFN